MELLAYILGGITIGGSLYTAAKVINNYFTQDKINNKVTADTLFRIENRITNIEEKVEDLKDESIKTRTQINFILKERNE